MDELTEALQHTHGYSIGPDEGTAARNPPAGTRIVIWFPDTEEGSRRARAVLMALETDPDMPELPEGWEDDDGD